ncbi:MAG: hypothetical protein R3181_05365 [Rubricoccaceae bacterium]|nr:hypothetical protein [Rubricoccaceae bacterium]
MALALALAAGPATAQPDSLATLALPWRFGLQGLTLGDSTVALSEHASVAEGMDLLVLHDDENTASEAGLRFVTEYGGRLVELLAQGERHVAFAIGGRTYSVDPNRIFTDRGVRRTLGADSTDAGAVALVRLLGDVLVALYDPTGVVVTLHNNTPDNYSALSYVDGGVYAQDAEAVHLEPGEDPDDFFFVTDRALFEALAARGFNAVLQDNARVTDDGSLSVWAAKHRLPYVNVEAEHGHLDAQLRMLRALGEVLAERAAPGGE